MGFLNFIFIAVLVIYILGLLSRVALRVWIGKKNREFNERYGSTGRPQDGKRPKEGEIKIEQTARQEKKVNKSVGDYVEYEEVDEKCGDGTEKN